MRDSYANRNHCPSHEMWSYERDGRWWGWSFVRGSTVVWSLSLPPSISPSFHPSLLPIPLSPSSSSSPSTFPPHLTTPAPPIIAEPIVGTMLYEKYFWFKKVLWTWTIQKELWETGKIKHLLCACFINLGLISTTMFYLWFIYIVLLLWEFRTDHLYAEWILWPIRKDNLS